jgi:isocitrate lyase
MGAEKLWASMHSEAYVHALGALTGQQAVQMACAGLKAIYLSGWQVAADANTGGFLLRCFCFRRKTGGGDG